MPYVEGESLRNRLAREPQLPLADALRITRAVADALGYAQRQGIIHRDVKPENILLQGERCVLADFGVARAVDAAGERLTETGFALGTPAYMSPEQGAADRHLDPRSDIYSLGCVVYEMLAGEPPFTGRTAQALIARRLADPVPDLCTVRDVPRQVERAVRQALARAPADRFADAPAFARALETAASAPRVTPSPAVRRGLLAAAAVLLVALAGAGVWLRARPAAEDARDTNLLAVAPFEVLEPSLQVWREGMADVLSRTLDGAGPIRTVSPSVVLRRWSGRADRTSAEELGRRTGRGVDRLRRRGAAGAGLGDAPRRPARSRRRNGKDGYRGLGRSGSDRRARRLARHPGAASALVRPGDRLGPPDTDRLEVAARSEGVPPGRTVLPARAVGLGAHAVRPGDRGRQHVRAGAGTDVHRAQLVSADGGRVPAAARSTCGARPFTTTGFPRGTVSNRRRLLRPCGGRGDGCRRRMPA